MSVKTQAFVNFYAAIGTLEKFVEFDAKAKEIAKQQNLVIRFNVKGGPDGLLIFKDGKVSTTAYDGRSVNIHLYCKTPELFNDVVDGKGMPLPLKGLFKTLSFMGNEKSPFSQLTNEMGSIMRTGKRLDGTPEPKMQTLLSFYAMAAAIAQIGNVDPKGSVAGCRIAEGEISLEITGEAAATIVSKGGKLTCKMARAENPRSFMAFSDIDTAGKLIAGEVDSMSCLSSGKLVMKGFIPMLDDLNRILNIVPRYLS